MASAQLSPATAQVAETASPVQGNPVPSAAQVAETAKGGKTAKSGKHSEEERNDLEKVAQPQSVPRKRGYRQANFGDNSALVCLAEGPAWDKYVLMTPNWSDKYRLINWYVMQSVNVDAVFNAVKSRKAGLDSLAYLVGYILRVYACSGFTPRATMEEAMEAHTLGDGTKIEPWAPIMAFVRLRLIEENELEQFKACAIDGWDNATHWVEQELPKMRAPKPKPGRAPVDMIASLTHWQFTGDALLPLLQERFPGLLDLEQARPGTVSTECVGRAREALQNVEMNILPFFQALWVVLQLGDIPPWLTAEGFLWNLSIFRRQMGASGVPFLAPIFGVPPPETLLMRDIRHKHWCYLASVEFQRFLDQELQAHQQFVDQERQAHQQWLAAHQQVNQQVNQQQLMQDLNFHQWEELVCVLYNQWEAKQRQYFYFHLQRLHLAHEESRQRLQQDHQQFLTRAYPLQMVPSYLEQYEGTDPAGKNSGFMALSGQAVSLPHPDGKKDSLEVPRVCSVHGVDVEQFTFDLCRCGCGMAIATPNDFLFGACIKGTALRFRSQGSFLCRLLTEPAQTPSTEGEAVEPTIPSRKPSNPRGPPPGLTKPGASTTSPSTKSEAVQATSPSTESEAAQATSPSTESEAAQATSPSTESEAVQATSPSTESEAAHATSSQRLSSPPTLSTIPESDGKSADSA